MLVQLRKINFVDIEQQKLETFMLNRKSILRSLLTIMLIVSNSIYVQGADQSESESNEYWSVGVQCLMAKIDADMNKLVELEKEAIKSNWLDLADIQSKLQILREKHIKFYSLSRQKPVNPEDESGSMGAMKKLFPEYSECDPNE